VASADLILSTPMKSGTTFSLLIALDGHPRKWMIYPQEPLIGCWE
jgi:hypothetical protein